MEHKHQSLADAAIEMHLRCPTCFKLYAVDAKTIYVPKPEFECTQCEQKFWVNFPDALEYSEVVAFPVEWNENYRSSASADEMAEQSLSDELDTGLLSKMSFESEKTNLDYQEDTPFGIEYEKSWQTAPGDKSTDFIEGDDSDGGPEVGSAQWSIDREWEKVLNNYDTKAYHDTFIAEGKKLNALEHVYEKYKGIKETNSFDPVAKVRFKQVERLIQRHANSAQAKKAAQSKGQFKGIKSYYKYLPWASLGVAGILIAAGFSHESLNHLAGLGFALIFLTGALSLLKESDL